jgi:hypothetical protein
MYPEHGLSELAGRDLAGYRLAKCFFMELDNSLMGTFPVLISKYKEPFLCETKDIVKKVAALLKPRRIKIGVVWTLYNPTEGYGFGLSDFKISRQCLLVINEARFNDISQEEDPFKWAPGLLLPVAGPTREEFDKDIDYILKSFREIPPAKIPDSAKSDISSSDAPECPKCKIPMTKRGMVFECDCCGHEEIP